MKLYMYLYVCPKRGLGVLSFNHDRQVFFMPRETWFAPPNRNSHMNSQLVVAVITGERNQTEMGHGYGFLGHASLDWQEILCIALSICCVCFLLFVVCGILVKRYVQPGLGLGGGGRAACSKSKMK